jgi:hypothetical protein
LYVEFVMIFKLGPNFFDCFDYLGVGFGFG